jgi:hypothetical protein
MPVILTVAFGDIGVQDVAPDAPSDEHEITPGATGGDLAE